MPQARIPGFCSWNNSAAGENARVFFVVKITAPQAITLGFQHLNSFAVRCLFFSSGGESERRVGNGNPPLIMCLKWISGGGRGGDFKESGGGRGGILRNPGGWHPQSVCRAPRKRLSSASSVRNIAARRPIRAQTVLRGWVRHLVLGYDSHKTSIFHFTASSSSHWQEYVLRRKVLIIIIFSTTSWNVTDAQTPVKRVQTCPSADLWIRRTRDGSLQIPVEGVQGCVSGGPDPALSDKANRRARAYELASG